MHQDNNAREERTPNITFMQLVRTLSRPSAPVILSASVPTNVFQLDFLI